MLPAGALATPGQPLIPLHPVIFRRLSAGGKVEPVSSLAQRDGHQPRHHGEATGEIRGPEQSQSLPGAKGAKADFHSPEVRPRSHLGEV